MPLCEEPEEDELMTTDAPEISTKAPADAPANASRRALLRGASVALPTILTLHSGAALARSSNLMGTVDSASRAKANNGQIQCLDRASAVDGTPARLDLGEQPMLHVQYITPRNYYRGKSNGQSGDLSRPVSIETMCREGGVFWYREQSGSWWSTEVKWKQIAQGYNRRGVEPGFLVSATALSSFASSIKAQTNF
jgi:hypothetical protein